MFFFVSFFKKKFNSSFLVSEKEKEQGREPMLKEEKGFGEYARP